jgi:hypothetical protein
MKLSLLSLICVLICTPVYLFSQQNMEFTHAKIIGDNKTVYFNVKGLGEDDADRAVLLESLLQDDNILDGRIYTSSSLKTKCQLTVRMNISPEYIRPMLNSFGYDYDFTTVSVNGAVRESTEAEIFRAEFSTPQEGFPLMQYTGNKEQDEENYRIAKDQWISENEKKYNKQKSNGTAVYPIVISKDDFNNYSDEKKASLLAEPDKYIIK